MLTGKIIYCTVHASEVGVAQIKTSPPNRFFRDFGSGIRLLVVPKIAIDKRVLEVCGDTLLYF